MPRQRRLRKVVAPPKFKGYKPYGTSVGSTREVELLYEEYEALKLADYDLLKHDQAAELMGISRPTFARIYESARRKIARAMVETRPIKAVYGNALLDKNWFVCQKCHARFTIPVKMVQQQCAVCSAEQIKPLHEL